MNRKKGSKKALTWLNKTLLILLLLSLGIFSIGLYFLYMDLPGEPQFINVETKTFDNSSLNTQQFYPNMKFNHNIISFSINPNCNQEKQTKMISAFRELSDKISEISFKETLMNSDIKITCSQETEESNINKDYFIAGEGGAKEIIQTGRYNIITEGLILLYQTEKKAVKCDYPNTELHELIHVFGFGHSDNKNSLMYPILESCEQQLDQSIIEEIKKIYSEENLPDLYFEEAKAIKKGKYLDFNITIKNSGAIDSKNIDFTIFDNGEIVETKILDEIKYGA